MSRLELLLAIAMAIGFFCLSHASAKKPIELPADDRDPVYTMVPFMLPYDDFTGSHIHDLSDNGYAVGEGRLEGEPVGDTGYVKPVLLAVHYDILTGQYTTLAGGTEAYGVNQRNQIVGCAVTFGDVPYSSSALFWRRPAPELDPAPLPPLDGHEHSSAKRINDAGIVVGQSWKEESGHLGVIWQANVDEDDTVTIDGPVMLPPCPGDTITTVTGITEVVEGAALACGGSYAADGSLQHPVMWLIQLDENGDLLTPVDKPVALGLVGQSTWIPYAINNGEDIIGNVSPLPVYAPIDGTPEYLPLTRRAEAGVAFDMNDDGVIVGWVSIPVRFGNQPYTLQPRAAIWKDGQVSLLQDKIRDKSWDNLFRAHAINKAGVIAGEGYYEVTGDQLAFIAIPDTP
jgi:hypothetical protein